MSEIILYFILQLFLILPKKKLFFLKESIVIINCLKFLFLTGLFIKYLLIELLKTIVSHYGDALNELKLTAIKPLH